MIASPAGKVSLAPGFRIILYARVTPRFHPVEEDTRWPMMKPPFDEP
jgi:hypothetical protein